MRAGAAVIALALVAAYLLLRGGDDTTASPQSATPQQQPTTAGTPSPTAAAPSASTTPAATPPSTPSATERPPTLQFRVLRQSYITVRVPGGRTLVSRLFTKGERRSFDQKVLEVVNGRPSAVRFTVNGTQRKPGPADEPETFTVRRR